MTITIIGSTQYREKFDNLKQLLLCEGHTVFIPAFDDHKDYDELDVCKHNKSLIEKADIVYIIWDGRSMGTIFDFGMCFALNKPIKIEYIEPKTLAGVMRKYEESYSSIF